MDYLDRIITNEDTVRLTLPDGHLVIGKVEKIVREKQAVRSVSGILQHPEAGIFSFEVQDAGKLQGSLSFDSKATEWKIEASPDGMRFVEAPRADAFRPRNFKLPNAQEASAAGISRDKGEAALRKDLKIETLSADKLRIGEVELDRKARSIRIPVTVNMSSGLVEYVLVAKTGKVHESMFATTVSPRDIHLAALLLGLKPANLADGGEGKLAVPADAAVSLSVEWTDNGSLRTRSISDLVTMSAPDSGIKQAGSMWVYNGSRFNDAGFAALAEGSIISLINDETALINNSGRDRTEDESHRPAANLLPAIGTKVTFVISPPALQPAR